MVNRCLVVNTPNGIKGKIEFQEVIQDEWHEKWNDNPIYYTVENTSRTILDKDIKKALNLAMTTWDLEINVSFRPNWWWNFNKNQIRISFKSSAEDEIFRTQSSVLAYAYFPGQGSYDGVVVFNDDYIWTLNGKEVTALEAFEKGWIKNFSDPTNKIKTYNIIHVLIHELGHTLGLKHDADGTSDDVMDAYYSGQLELSERDIYRIHLKYPPRVYSNWDWYSRLKNAVRRMKLRAHS